MPRIKPYKIDKATQYRNLERKLTHLELKKVIWQIIMRKRWYGLSKADDMLKEMKKSGIYTKSMEFFEQSGEFDRYRIPYKTENKDEEMVYNLLDRMGNQVIKLNVHMNTVISFTIDEYTAKKEYDQTKKSLIYSKKKFEKLDNIKWEDYKKITKELRRR